MEIVGVMHNKTFTDLFSQDICITFIIFWKFEGGGEGWVDGLGWE